MRSSLCHCETIIKDCSLWWTHTPRPYRRCCVTHMRVCNHCGQIRHTAASMYAWGSGWVDGRMCCYSRPHPSLPLFMMIHSDSAYRCCPWIQTLALFAFVCSCTRGILSNLMSKRDGRWGRKERVEPEERMMERVDGETPGSEGSKWTWGEVPQLVSSQWIVIRMPRAILWS